MTHSNRSVARSLNQAILGTLVVMTLVGCGGGGGSDGATASAQQPAASQLFGPPPSVPSVNPEEPVVAPEVMPEAEAPVSTPVPPAAAPAPVTTSAVTLSWTPPSLNMNGSALTNLAGYRIYFGTSPNNLNQSIKISGVGVTSRVIEDLTPATWYFAVRAYNASSTESSLSQVVSRKIS